MQVVSNGFLYTYKFFLVIILILGLGIFTQATQIAAKENHQAPATETPFYQRELNELPPGYTSINSMPQELQETLQKPAIKAQPKPQKPAIETEPKAKKKKQAPLQGNIINVPEAPNQPEIEAAPKPANNPIITVPLTNDPIIAVPPVKAKVLPQVPMEVENSIKTVKANNLETLLPNQNKAKPLKGIDISKSNPLNKPLELTLHGLIWTYIPALSEYPAEPRFERKLGDLETSFTFEFRKLGRHLLTFSRQYPSTGKLGYYTAEIMVEPTEKAKKTHIESIATSKTQAANTLQTPFNPASSRSNPNLQRVSTQVINDVREQLRQGNLEEAYQSLSSWPSSERGDIYDEAARTFFKANMPTKAQEMWQRNIAMSGDLGPRAVIGMMKVSIKTKDLSSVSKWMPDFLDLANRQNKFPKKDFMDIGEEDFTNIYTLLSSNANKEIKEPHTLLKFYQAYIELYPNESKPSVLYQMAQVLENPGDSQNLRRARDLYSTIYNDYPVDVYNQRAKQRLDFLNRQFFYIR